MARKMFGHLHKKDCVSQVEIVKNILEADIAFQIDIGEEGEAPRIEVVKNRFGERKTGKISLSEMHVWLEGVVSTLPGAPRLAMFSIDIDEPPIDIQSDRGRHFWDCLLERPRELFSLDDFIETPDTTAEIREARAAFADIDALLPLPVQKQPTQFCDITAASITIDGQVHDIDPRGISFTVNGERVRQRKRKS